MNIIPPKEQACLDRVDGADAICLAEDAKAAAEKERQKKFYENVTKVKRQKLAAEKKAEKELEKKEEEAAAIDSTRFWTNQGALEAQANAKAQARMNEHRARLLLIKNELTEPRVPFPTELLDGVLYEDWFNAELSEFLRYEFGPTPDFTTKWNVFNSLGMTGFGRQILSYLDVTDANGLKTFWQKAQ